MDAVSKILLVEDDVLIAMSESVFLKQEGYDVVIVNDGESAVEEAADGSYDLILMDIDLGSGIDGTDAAKEILQFCAVPIVFLSSHVEPEIVKKTEGITSYGYIVKNSGNTVLSASIKMAFKLFNANKKLEERKDELAWEKNRLRKYINTAEVMLVLVDPEAKIRLINKKGCELLGSSEEELLGTDWVANFILEDDQNKIKELFSQIFSGNTESLEYNENWIKCKNSEKKLIAWHNSLVRDKDGKITGILCSGEDITELKKYEKSIEDSRNDFYQLFYNMSDGAAIYKPVENASDFIVVDVNEAGQRITDRHIDDMMGRSILEVFPPLGELGLVDVLKKVSETGEPGYLPVSFYKDSKVSKWVENRIFKLPSGLVVSFFTDKTAEAELIENEQRLEIINELGSDYSYCHRILPDGSLKAVWSRGSFDEITGYTSEELRDKGGWQTLVHPDDIPAAGEYVAALMRGEESSVTARIVTKDGSCRWIEDKGKPWFDEAGKVIGTFGHAQDITEQKLLSDELKQSELKHRMLYEHAPLPYQSLDKDGCFIDVNPAWLRTLGYTRDEVIGHRFSEFLHDDWKPHFEKNFPAFKKRGYVSDVQFRMKRKDGAFVYVSFEGCIGYNTDGKFRQTYCVFQDITARVKTEKQNELLMRELNHRVKNNLFMVSSLLQLKNNELADKADLTDIIRQVDAISLIHRHLEQNRNVAEVDFKEYIKELTESLLKTAAPYKVDLKIEIDEGMLPTNTVLTLGLIINELATNAVKYGFTADEKYIFGIKQMKSSDSAYIKLKVYNNGRPFPEDMDIDTSGGLGLKLIKTLCAQLDGSVELQKKPVTSFILTCRI